MEFKHLNQPDFDRERDGVVHEILKDVWEGMFTGKVTLSAGTPGLRRAYNEGYKQALRDWYGVLSSSSTEEIISEVDKIDGEST